jgi:hypothetical protein
MDNHTAKYVEQKGCKHSPYTNVTTCVECVERAAFKAGREYHDPGYYREMLRWNTFGDWKRRMESYTEYGKMMTRRAK